MNYEYRNQVRFRDTDGYGIVHHSNYFCYFEEARMAFSRKILGFSGDMLNGRALKFPVIEATCKYRQAVQYNFEETLIQLEFSIINNCKVRFIYKMKSASGKVIATGETIHAMVDDQEQLLLSVPKWIMERIEAYERGEIGEKMFSTFK